MSNARHLLFFDSDCPFCQLQIRLLSKLDWFNTVEFIPLKKFSESLSGVHIEENELNQAIHCVTPKKTIFKGPEAIRFLAMRMPLLVPMSLIMWLPGMMFIAQKIYNLISKNRYVLSKFIGCKDSCALEGSKK
ncbi:MAG: DUF393 domain-containing protein [Verrucomicrobiota bacterium]|nr:DUF393 domain-containing protein [Verrucomicrobiota bacterium]